MCSWSVSSPVPAPLATMPSALYEFRDFCGEGPFGERGGVFDVHVRENRDVGVEALPEANRLGGRAGDDPLVGESGTGVDVDPHERRAGRRGDR